MRSKKQRKTKGIAGSIAIGLMSGFIVTIVGAVILTALIAGEKLTEQQMPYGVAAVLLISSFLGAAMAAGNTQGNRIVICLANGGVYVLTLLCITALIFDGAYNGVWVTALLILGGSVSAGMVGVRKKEHKFRGSLYGSKR